MDEEKLRQADDLLGSMFQEHARKALESKRKYAKLVARLEDLEFAGLYAAVMDERTTRMARLIATNPAVRAQFIQDLRDDLAKQEDEKN